MKNIKLHSPQGFTLIEVLVAVIILAFGLVLVAEGMSRTEQAFRISQNLVIASQIADEKLMDSEIEVRQRHKLRYSFDSDKDKFPGKSFDWKREIRGFSHETIRDETKLNRVDVTLDWKDGPVRKNEKSFSTLIMNREKEK